MFIVLSFSPNHSLLSGSAKCFMAYVFSKVLSKRHFDASFANGLNKAVDVFHFPNRGQKTRLLGEMERKDESIWLQKVEVAYFDDPRRNAAGWEIEIQVGMAIRHIVLVHCERQREPLPKLFSRIRLGEFNGKDIRSDL